MSSDAQPHAGGPPKEGLELMNMLAFSSMRTNCIYSVTRLGIPDLLKDGPKHVSELAKLVQIDGEKLHRILRALSCEGTRLFDEDAAGNYTLNNMSRLLLNVDGLTLRWLTLMTCNEAFAAVNGKFHEAIVKNEDPFKLTHGVHCFEYFQKHKDTVGEEFNKAMLSLPSNMSVPHAPYDFGTIKTLVDVGGSHGVMLANILKKYPSIEKGIVFDLQHVLDATAPPALPNISKHGGSFLDQATFPTGADAYIMKHIIHDWNDEACVTILSNCRKSMVKGGKVIIVDAVVPQSGDASLPFAKWMDILMFVSCPGGKERTLEQFTKLITAAGLKIAKITPVPFESVSIIETVEA